MAYFEKGVKVRLDFSPHEYTILRIVGDELLLARKKRRHSKQIVSTCWVPKDWAKRIEE